MKSAWVCRNEKHEFNLANEAKIFAHRLGVEKEFLFNSSYSEIESPVIIYVFRNSLNLFALVILYTLTREVGLWVHPIFGATV